MLIMREFLQQIKQRDFFWLSILVGAYFYCLPLGRFSIGFWSSDFRIYDYTSVVFIVFALQRGKVLGQIRQVFRQNNTFTYYARWLILLCIFSLLWHVLYSGFDFILPTLIRLFRFIVYFSTGAWVIALCHERARWNALLNWYILLTLIVGLIAFLQGLNFIPNFWPEYWRKMYDNLDPPVATLSPHHKHMGVVMLVGVGLALYKNRVSKGFWKLFWGFAGLIFLTVPLFTGSRTILLAYLGFIPAYIYYNRSRAILSLGALVFLGTAYVFYLGDDIMQPIQQRYQEKFVNPVEKFGYEGLYQERTVIYWEILDLLRNEPYLLLTGTGFQNIQNFLGANGAHNNYLQALVEQGILGFYLFMSILFLMFRNFARSAKLHIDRRIREYSIHITVIFFGVCMTFFVGESMWGQAAMFTLPGQLMTVFGLGAAPGFWKEMKARGYSWAQKTDF